MRKGLPHDLRDDGATETEVTDSGEVGMLEDDEEEEAPVLPDE